MLRSLGEFNISLSSSVDIHNITWTKRNPRDPDIIKKKNTRKISPTNIIYTDEIKVKEDKLFKIIENDKSKNNTTFEKFQNASVDICLIERGFKKKSTIIQQIFVIELKDEIKMSANTIRKAKKLVETEGVAKIDDQLYQVKSSSDPDKSYMVEKDSCDCLGFKNFYKFHHGKGLKANCSHN